jgi:hypothetical protein
VKTPGSGSSTRNGGGVRSQVDAPAAGLVTAELILDGHTTSLDSESVSVARFSNELESVERTGF